MPTVYAEPGDDGGKVLDSFLQVHAAAELIIKPAVGSGARDAQRYPRAATAQMRAHLSRLLAEKRSALLQPYLERIDALGETALIYITANAVMPSARRPCSVADTLRCDRCSRLKKLPCVPPQPTNSNSVCASQGRLPFKNLLYAHLGLLRDAHGAPCVLELELAEPSRYLGYSVYPAARLARAVAERLQRHARGG